MQLVFSHLRHRLESFITHGYFKQPVDTVYPQLSLFGCWCVELVNSRLCLELERIRPRQTVGIVLVSRHILKANDVRYLNLLWVSPRVLIFLYEKSVWPLSVNDQEALVVAPPFEKFV